MGSCNKNRVTDCVADACSREIGRMGSIFCYTDTIDDDDAMHAYIQNISNPDMQWHFEKATVRKADSNPRNETSQTVKSLSVNKSEGSTKKAGSGARA
jgi:hypothetical protein